MQRDQPMDGHPLPEGEVRAYRTDVQVQDKLWAVHPNSNLNLSLSHALIGRRITVAGSELLSRRKHTVLGTVKLKQCGGCS